MTTDPFLEEDFRVLTPEAFQFVLTNELKRAVRSQNFVTLVVVEPSIAGVPGGGNGDREQAVKDVARLISRDVRETDLLSRTEPGQLSVVLLDADLESSIGVIDRLMARLDHYQFPTPLTFEVGAACCPTHGADAATLRRAAESRPVRDGAIVPMLSKGAVMTNYIRAAASISLAVLLSAALGAQAAPQNPTTPQGAPPPAPVGTTGASSGVRPNTTPDYKLVPGDKLRIEVYKDAQLSQSLQVRPDGKITLPLVGDLPAAGHTSNELRDAITTLLKEYNTNPVVTVIVVETVPPTVYVMGEVNNPGPQPLTGEVTVMQALATAGGFKDFAKTKDIRIQRKGPSGLTTLHFNYKDAVNGRGKIIVLQPGDTVIVP